MPERAMTDAMIELARRASACPKWRWMPGMRTLGNMRVIHDPARWPDRPCALREGGWIDTAPPRPLGDDLPDLTDPATLGCLLALVREAWGTAFTSPDYEAGASGLTVAGWEVIETARFRTVGVGRTEAEALVAALEGAP